MVSQVFSYDDACCYIYIDILFCFFFSKCVCLEEAQKVCAREQLYKLCGVRHWKAPLYTFFNQDGPDNTKL